MRKNYDSQEPVGDLEKTTPDPREIFNKVDTITHRILQEPLSKESAAQIKDFLQASSNFAKNVYSPQKNKEMQQLLLLKCIDKLSKIINNESLWTALPDRIKQDEDTTFYLQNTIDSFDNPRNYPNLSEEEKKKEIDKASAQLQSPKESLKADLTKNFAQLRSLWDSESRNFKSTIN